MFKKIGQILIEENIITQQDVDKVLEYQKNHRELKFGEILVMWGIINENILKEYLEIQEK
jgi:hypothetical protein